MDLNYVPAVITASVAFIAAIIAQVLNNIFTSRRENKKYYRDIYGSLISPNLNLIMKYCYQYKGPFDPMNEKTLKLSEVISNLEKSLQYFGPDLQLHYSQYNINRYLDGASNEVEKRLEFELAFYYIIYAIEVIKKAGIKTDKQYISILESVAIHYAYLSIGTKFQDYEVTKNNLISLNRFSLDTLNHFSIGYYVDIVKNSKDSLGEMLIERVNTEITNYLNE